MWSLLSSAWHLSVFRVCISLSSVNRLVVFGFLIGSRCVNVTSVTSVKSSLYIPLKPPPLWPPLNLLLPGTSGLWNPPSSGRPVKSLLACWKRQYRAAAPGPRPPGQAGMCPRRPSLSVVGGPGMGVKGWLGNRGRLGVCRMLKPPCCCCWLYSGGCRNGGVRWSGRLFSCCRR